ncbi:MAG: FGGY family carbohydrate kinase, partial [Pontimonas sp.]
MTTLGIDLGTGSVKAAVVSSKGAILSHASKTYSVESPSPGWAESDPAQWLHAAEEVAQEAIRLSPQAPVAVGFSGQMHGVVIADAFFTPLRPAL